MVSVALGLGKSVIAEYVEDARTLALLRKFGVDLVQGYHLDRPVVNHPALKQCRGLASRLNPQGGGIRRLKGPRC